MATLYILYGSATGNAENIAKTLSKESLPTNGFSQTVCEPLEKYRRFQDVWKDKPSSAADAVKQEYHGILVVVSTTGNGDAPENASRFVRFLKRKTTSPDTFQHCAFGVLALGDTNYDQFCNSGKTIDKRLNELGGHRAKDLACADEATGLEQVVEPWTATVLQDIHNKCFPSTNKNSSCGGTENKESVAEAETESSTTEASPTETKAPETATTTTTTTTTTASETTVTESTEKGPSVAQKEPNATTTTLSFSWANAHGPCSCCSWPPAPSADYVEPTPPPAAPVDQSPSPLFVLYASKTGNAEHIAKDLAATYETLIKNPIAKTYFPSVVCCELDQFKKRCVSHWDEAPPAGGKHGVIVVSSTTGNGEIPENGNRFERYIKRRTTPKTAFQHVAYAVLGLGDTNYDIFCAAAKNIDKKLAELAGTRVQPLACADEATGLEEGVEPFINSILVTMNDFCRPNLQTANAASPTTTSKESAAKSSRKSSEAEEKKEADAAPAKNEEMAPPPPPPTSRGVRLVRSLLDIAESEMLPEVHPSDLPGMTSSLSSCELISEEGRRNRSHSLAEQDAMTAVSSVSTNALHYTHTRPYTSTIVGARYLTNSSTDAAKEATKILADSTEDDDDQKIQQAMQVYESHFPLVGEQAERNSKRVVEMSFSLPDDSTYDYQPGDSVGLIVSNPPQAVRFILDMLKQHHGIVETQRVRLDSKGPITVKEALCQHIDLSSPVRNRRIVHSLSGFATDPHEIFALQHIACKSSRGSLFQRYMEDQRITIVELLRDFPSCQSIPLEGLFSMLSSIPPRYYSVSSSPLKSKRALTVAFSVVDYMTPSLPHYDSRRVGGVATRHLEVLASPFLSGQDGPSRWKLRIFPKPSVEFRLPILESTPMVLIGPGTGIAPFVGFLQHRQAQKEATKAAAQQVVEGTWRGGYEVEQDELQCDDDATATTQKKNASIRVYFGCRHENHDFLYRNELGSFAKQGLIQLHKVHSRDNNNSKEDKKEKYVQDVMDSSLVDWIVHQKAMVYVCGDGNAMAKDVQRKIVELLEGSVENPLDYLDTMKKQHRFVMDIWS